MRQASAVDPITLAVVRGSFVSTVLQMRTTLVRTAHSPTLYDRYDFSCALLSDKGEIIGMSEDFSGHVFALSLSMADVLRKHGDDIHPEDVLITNEPYSGGGSHLNDVAFFKPFFSDGRLLMFTAVRAHWADVGGATPGSFSGQDTEIYQEGVIIPPVKLVEKGKLNQPLWDVMFMNMRQSDERRGDALAMLETLRLGETRAAELCAKYGTETIEQCREAILNNAEQVMRQEVAKLPDGVYHYENYLDKGGPHPHPLPIMLEMTIEGESITFDYTGTSPQVEAPTNCGPSVTQGGTFTMVKSLLDPLSPVSGGSFRPFKFNIPEGTITSAKLPAPVSGVWEVMRGVEAVVTGAFAQFMSEPLVADSIGTSNHVFIGGYDREAQKHFIFYESPFGGTPAADGTDGATGCLPFDAGDIPSTYRAEMIERDAPVLIESYTTRLDGEGPGQYRSGFGFDRRVRVLADNAQLNVEADRAVIPPFGTHGGYPGSVNAFKVIRDGQEIEPAPESPGKIKTFLLKRGDTVVMKPTAGGGLGDPLARDPDLVRRELLEGYVSPDRARDIYGVVVGEAGEVDVARTESLRKELANGRSLVKVVPTDQDDFDEAGCRLCRIDRSLAARIGASDGDMVEYVPRTGPPLRAVAQVDGDADGQGLLIGPRGRGILGVRGGDELELRSLAGWR